MATGFIYIVDTLTKEYVQKGFSNVPTEYGNRIYFGPCKKQMRPKMRPGDYIFGVSPSTKGKKPRRIVFICIIEERITFEEAYRRFPDLHGPPGPIHVRPVKGRGSFPHCSYEHIPGSIHADDWENDLASRDLDAFFVCLPRSDLVGRWLGEYGPEVDQEILDFFKTCSVHGSSLRNLRNVDATLRNPIAHGRQYQGLHLETDAPLVLVSLCEPQVESKILQLDLVPIPKRRMKSRSRCGRSKSSDKCD